MWTARKRGDMPLHTVGTEGSRTTLCGITISQWTNMHWSNIAGFTPTCKRCLKKHDARVARTVPE